MSTKLTFLHQKRPFSRFSSAFPQFQTAGKGRDTIVFGQIVAKTSKYLEKTPNFITEMLNLRSYQSCKKPRRFLPKRPLSWPKGRSTEEWRMDGRGPGQLERDKCAGDTLCISEQFGAEPANRGPASRRQSDGEWTQTNFKGGISE